MSEQQSDQRRIAIGVEYQGAAYYGWQKQLKPSVPTVQSLLEVALSKVANHPITLICAGRTDAKVHATQQVAHFDTHAFRPNDAWLRGTNTYLPDSIRVVWAQQVNDGFHARFSAVARRYHYFIHNSVVKSAHFSDCLTTIDYPLDVEAMHKEAQVLIGEQDFSSFRAVACQSRTAMRNVNFVRVVRHKELILVDIQANAFLLHMVRNIVGALLEIGAGRQPSGWLKQLLLLKDRTQAPPTAKPNGLFLVDVSYPDAAQIPVAYKAPLFMNFDD